MSGTQLKSFYRSDIDGLRALAVSFVVFYHAFPDILKCGFIGVDIFFVISGYLIGSIILRHLSVDRFSFAEFYVRRIVRIFPALLLVLLSVLIAGKCFLLTDEYQMLGKHVAGGAGFVANIVYWLEAGYWDVRSTLKPLLHLWSLGVEEQFYIIIPLVLAFAWKRKYNVLFIIIALLILSFSCNLYFYYQKERELMFYMPFTRFWEIFAGVLLAYYFIFFDTMVLAAEEKVDENLHYLINNSVKNEKQNLRYLFFIGYSFIVFVVVKSLQTIWKKADYALCKVLKKDVAESNGRYLKNVFSFLGFILLIVSLKICHQDMFPGHRALWPVLGAVFIIAAGSSAWLNKKILSHKILVGIGLISYPFYLWHWPLLAFCHILGDKFLEENERIFLYVACILTAFILALFTYLFLERPIRFGKGNKNVKAIIVSILMAMMCLAGLLVMHNEEIFNEKTSLNEKMVVEYIQNDSSILEYAPEAKVLSVARFKNAHSDKTVAIIGDSHAAAAYPGIADRCMELGMNVVLLKYRCDQFTNQMERDLFLNILKSKKDIKYVIIFLRGVVNIQGTDIDLSFDEKVYVKDYKNFLQNTVDTLQKLGKKIYIVSENPVFNFTPKDFLRSFSFNANHNPWLPKESVYNHQKDYLTMLEQIQGAEIINGLDVFCPHDKCSMFDENGITLYLDDDHLSVYGSQYLVKNLLEPYLVKIANEKEE